MDKSQDKKWTQPPGRSAILIAGPTASGKSALALDVAAALDGVIVNADSMQLYRELRLVSARPSAQEEARVPHRLYGVLPASTAFSTGAWLRRAQEEVETIWAAAKTPVLVGGTGLYFKALTDGFADLPQIPPAIREEARRLAEEEGVAGLRQALSQEGDERAAAALDDPQRLARALEVLRATGRPLAHWQTATQSEPFLSPKACMCLVLAPPRAWLHERIAQRTRGMLSEDGLAEVRGLLAQNLDPALPAMRAIGVAEIRAYLAGTADLEETAERLTVATRQYAKRQETWFRNQMPTWQRIDPSGGIDLKNTLGPK